MILKARSLGNAAGLKLSEVVGSLCDNTALASNAGTHSSLGEVRGQTVKKGHILAHSQLCLLLSLVNWTPAGIYQ